MKGVRQMEGKEEKERDNVMKREAGRILRWHS